MLGVDIASLKKVLKNKDMVQTLKNTNNPEIADAILKNANIPQDNNNQGGYNAFMDLFGILSADM